MGLTQHVHGFDNLAMFVNLMLMKGNIGRQGAGISPCAAIRNVQGQRTVGISEKPELVPNDRLKELFGFDPPMEKGMNTVEACEGIIDGKVHGLHRPRRQFPARGARSEHVRRHGPTCG